MKKRRIVQISFLSLAAAATINHTYQLNGGGISWLSDAYLHYVCPICGVNTLYNFIVSTTPLVERMFTATAAIIGISMILAILAGSVFCGWICPFGAYQDLISDMGKKIYGNKFNKLINPKVDKYLRYTRYLVLLWVIYLTTKTAYVLMDALNPYHGLLNLLKGEFAIEGLLILAAVTTASFFINRPWCKYICPYGAVLGFSNRFRIIKLKRNTESCIGCKKCDRNCPMNIKVSEKTNISQNQCISCMECTSKNVCPIEKTVTFKI